jgi:hypothetical protein
MTTPSSASNDAAAQNSPAALEAREQLGKLLALNLSTCHIEVLLAANLPREEMPVFRRVELARGMDEMFRELVADIVQPLKNKLAHNDVDLDPFTVDDVDSRSHIEYLDLVAYEAINKQLEPLETYQDFASFKQSEALFVHGLRFYVVLVQPQQGPPAYFFRYYPHMQLLSESKRFLGMSMHENLYDRVSEPVFLIDRDIDCVSYGETMFILSKSRFYSIFAFEEALEQRAQETLESIRLRELITPFDRFARDCMRDRNKMLTLRNISLQPYLQTLTIDDLEKVIKRYNLGLGIESVGNSHGRKRQIRYDPKRIRDLLKLLNDSYGKSDLTSESYYMLAKRGIKTR